MVQNSTSVAQDMGAGNGANGGQGTPSALSPTPSPAGSVGSVGSSSSQTSGYMSGGGAADVVRTATATAPNPAAAPGGAAAPSAHAANQTMAISVGHAAMISKLFLIQYNLVQCHELWNAGDALIHDGNLSGKFTNDTDLLNTYRTNLRVPRGVLTGFMILPFRDLTLSVDYLTDSHFAVFSGLKNTERGWTCALHYHHF